MAIILHMGRFSHVSHQVQKKIVPFRIAGLDEGRVKGQLAMRDLNDWWICNTSFADQDDCTLDEWDFIRRNAQGQEEKQHWKVGDCIILQVNDITQFHVGIYLCLETCD